MVRSFGDYEDLVEAIPAVPREVFEDNYDEDDYDDSLFILISPDYCEEYSDRYELLAGLESYDSATQLVLIANNDYGGGFLVIGNKTDIEIEV